MSAQAVSGWIKRYKAGGLSALKSRRRGPPTGQTRRLTREREKHLQKPIRDRAPDQLKLDHALWTRKAVIEQEAGIAMPIRAVGGISEALGFYAAEAGQAGP